MTHHHLLQAALSLYDLDTRTLSIDKELPANWHGDLHLKITVADIAYSARFYHESRYDKTIIGVRLTDEEICEQFRFIDTLRAHGVPFMPYLSTAEGEPFAKVEWEGTKYRFLLFRWLDGVHLTLGTPSIAEKMGQMTRRYHDVSAHFHSDILRYHDQKIMYSEHLRVLQETTDICPLASADRDVIQVYLEECKKHLAQGFPSDMHPPRADQYIYASDLNNLNILWDESETITGIIDCEHISATDRISELTWMVKWYSRTQGIFERHAMSSENAEAFLRGYGAYDLLSPRELNRLPSLLWLSGASTGTLPSKRATSCKGLTRHRSQIIWLTTASVVRNCTHCVAKNKTVVPEKVLRFFVYAFGMIWSG
jgi:Ser/Thr protein kinase RdoA (MazF antagonist)